MANIFTSSIGKKLIMSITGAFLILFLTFHMIMNGALVFSDDAYNAIVNFLGANWYALVGTVILAAGVVFHFVYAIVLTVGNLRHAERFAMPRPNARTAWSGPPRTCSFSDSSYWADCCSISSTSGTTCSGPR